MTCDLGTSTCFLGTKVTLELFRFLQVMASPHFALQFVFVVSVFCVSDIDGDVNGCASVTRVPSSKMGNNTNIHYVHVAADSVISFSIPILSQVPRSTHVCLLYNETEMSQNYTEVQAQRNSTHITCNLKILTQDNMKKMIYTVHISVKDQKYVHNNFSVILYNCSNLASDYTHCTYLISNYNCVWCKNSKRCKYRNYDNCAAQTTPATPYIKQVHPSDGIMTGGTFVTVTGTDLGQFSDTVEISMGGTSCDLVKKNCTDTSNFDYQKVIVDQIVCKATQHYGSKSEFVQVTVNGILSANNQSLFTFKSPNVTDIQPKYGPVSGGTRITLSGSNLAIGNQYVTVWISTLPDTCGSLEVVKRISPNISTIECFTPAVQRPLNVSNFRIKYDQTHVIQQPILLFSYLPDPILSNITIKQGFLSGGTTITIIGDNLNNTANAILEANFANIKNVQKCERNSTVMMCKVPKAPSVPLDTNGKINNTSLGLKAHGDGDVCFNIIMSLKLDGIVKDFDFTYCRDPEFIKFENDVDLVGLQEHKITIRGKYLNWTASVNDYIVTVHDERCKVLYLSDTALECQARLLLRKNVVFMEYDVNVTVGNIQIQIGRVKYRVPEIETIIRIAAAAGGSLLVVVLIVVMAVGYLKFRSVRKKTTVLEFKLQKIENDCTRVAKEEFMDTNMIMSSVSKNIQEQGVPYHGYWQFACNVIVLDIDDGNSNISTYRDGLDKLECLLLDKIFLCSVISTMEKQKSVFLKDRSILGSNICAILMGKMEILLDIITVLLANSVKKSKGKKSLKRMFRRCETITEHLLTNWMILCLYPHFKNQSGSFLYLLYMAMLTATEAGPIDAITDVAKYTLCEKKLLTKSRSKKTENEYDPLLDVKPLTLNIAVANVNEIYTCKVFDCDTITQVKEKCLRQIYANYPASHLDIDPQDLILEWHEGFDDVLKLQDEDNTSVKDGQWLRLNTLRHYGVKNDSNMVLRHINEQTDTDYEKVHSFVINKDLQQLSTSNSITTEDTAEKKIWHLVKPVECEEHQEDSIIPELYLNRLFTTKQRITEYIRGLFDVILNKDLCPPPTKYLYDFMDKLASDLQIEYNTIHAWKSYSFPIRVWASLMKSPTLLFDVKIPSYVDVNLQLISQVFIETFSLTTKKCLQDAPPHMLVFHKEIQEYKAKVKQFFEEVRCTKDTSAIHKYLKEVNKLQETTNFDKTDVLKTIYLQIKPYLNEITTDLQTNKETLRHQFQIKFKDVVDLIESGNI